MTTSFKNKWALILGGSSGLGLATAKKLGEEGMNICIVHRTRRADLSKLEKEIQYIKDLGIEVQTFNKDALLTETREEVSSFLSKKKVAVLVHSIAKGSLKSLIGPEDAVLKKNDIDITLHAMGSSWYEWTRTLIDANCFSEHAQNIAFTSEGNSKVWPGYTAVSAAKSLLESLMRSMAVELAPLGIRTNCIQAGATRTPSFEMIPGSDKLAELATKRNPFNRLTQPKDVANAVYLLCRKEGEWINGTILKVDGGESLR